MTVEPAVPALMRGPFAMKSGQVSGSRLFEVYGYAFLALKPK
jgi:hypothetical protein